MALATRSSVYSNGRHKKYDTPVGNQPWQSSSTMRPWSFFRKRRLLWILLAVALIYLFVKNIPTDVPSVGQRIDRRTGRSQGRPVPYHPTPNTDTNHPGLSTPLQVYDGPVKFYNLAASLAPHLHKTKPRDNVVYLLHDLRSAASLIALACESARYERLDVHMAVLSLRDDSLDDILAMSGIDQQDCPIYWHDARPDNNAQSSRPRQSISLQSAVIHLHSTLRPSAFVVDQLQVKDQFFKNTLQENLDTIRVPLVTIPTDALTSMSWILALDGKALSLLNSLQFDIVITPYKESAGSLIKLLHSLLKANYNGLPKPRITVELPYQIDQFALRHLESFQWLSDRELGESKFVLRRRIDSALLTPAMSSLHTLESFYPSSWPLSHILVLSPDVELSPDYLQYLAYLALEYKYGPSSGKSSASLLGISLHPPDNFLQDENFNLDHAKGLRNKLVLTQSPSSTAALYFGDKWVELQNYLCLRLKHDATLSKFVISDADRKRSRSQPSWLAQASELMRARNYYMLYPGLTSNDLGPEKRLVTVHSELHQDPEEFAEVDVLTSPHSTGVSSLPIPPPNLKEGTILTGIDDSLIAHSPHAHLGHEQASRRPLSLPALLGLDPAKHEYLPHSEQLLRYSAFGHAATDEELAKHTAEALADKISLELGGCDTLDERDEGKIGMVGYWFCDV